MLELISGLTAACAWDVQELLVRNIGPQVPVFPLLLEVFASRPVALSLALIHLLHRLPNERAVKGVGWSWARQTVCMQRV